MSRRIVVAGGAGFLGSHVCDALLARGDRVVCVDNFATGRPSNIAHLAGVDGFTLVDQDITVGLDVAGPVDAVLNLASPASPDDFADLAIETLTVGSIGTRNCIELALAHDVPMLLASTSEVYGDPQVHPQTEQYWGNVNPIGPRSSYDEAKRFAEALTMAYARKRGLAARIARIFNTYGPRMKADDGRVVSNFVTQALSGGPVVVHGDGSQSRSFCYVDDQVTGLLALLGSDLVGPVNLGNPHELTVLELARLVIEQCGGDPSVMHTAGRVDDPGRRCPDISLARNELDWEPTTDLRIGLAATVDWFRTAA